MALPTYYDVGTVSVANGATAVTGSGTGWAGKIFAGDLLHDPAQGIVARIAADVTDNEALTLADGWPGTALVNASYAILFTADSVRASERTRRLLEALGEIEGGTGIGFNAFGPFAERTTYDDEAEGFVFLSTDGDGASITDPVIFIKRSAASADWSDAIEIAGATGPQGPQGETGAGVNWLGAWVAGSYEQYDAVEHNGSSYVANTATTEEPPHADWDLMAEKGATGETGQTGATGPQGEAGVIGNWLGAWTPGAYLQHDAVEHEGSSYIANTATSEEPPHADWDLVAQKGEQGEQGVPGSGSVDTVNGDPGPNVVLDADDIDDTSTTHKFATAAQLALADSALQSSAIGVSVQAWDEQLDSLSAASANGVSLVTAADYAAMRALLDLEAGTDFLSPAAIAAAYQPLDSDLTAIAALTTTAFGRAVLALANAGALATYAGVGTGNSPQFAAVNLGHATDTTLARSAAGVLTVEGVEIVTLSRAQNLTNKTLTDPAITGTVKEDVYTITDGAGFAIDPTNGSIQFITLGANRTPVAANWDDGESVTLRIDDGTARTITWSTIGVVWKGGAAPTLATSGYTEINIEKAGGVYRGVHVGDFAS